MKRSIWRVAAVAVVALTLRPTSAAAQATVNPTKVQFTASTDHNAVSSSGTPIVQSYNVDFFLVGASAPFQTVSLGKPTPDATNTVTVDLTSVFIGWPVVGTNYVADISAVGPGGTVPSALSNTFSFTSTPGCTYGLSSSSLNMAAAGGTGSTNVTAGTGCTWTATSGVTWISVTSGSNGTGNGPVNFSVSANSGSTSRTGTLTIAGQTFTVTQAAPCTYGLSSSSLNVAAAGGTGSTNVTSGTGCTWTATSGVTWISVTSGSNGTGNGPVNFSVSANGGTASRTGTLTIAGKTFTVTQAAPCTYGLSSSSLNVPAAGGTGSTNVTAGTGCTWTATSGVTWISVTSGSNGTGNGPVNFSVSANGGTASRTGTLTIAGQTFTVTQAAPCTYGLSSSSLNVPAAGGTGSTNVTAGTGCTWTATSGVTWISITSGSNGTGNGPVNFSVSANSASTSRTGTLTIGGQTLTVTEAGTNIPAPPTNVHFTAD